MTSSTEEGPIEIPKQGLILAMFAGFSALVLALDHWHYMGAILPLMLTIYAGCEVVILYLVTKSARRERDHESDSWLRRFVNRIPERICLVGLAITVTIGMLITIGIDWQQSVKIGLIAGSVPPLIMARLSLKRTLKSRLKPPLP